MYVKPRAITFADLGKAVQRDAGLGQVSQDEINSILNTGWVDPASGSVMAAPGSMTTTGNSVCEDANGDPTPCSNLGIPTANVLNLSAIPTWGWVGMAAVVGLLIFSSSKR